MSHADCNLTSKFDSENGLSGSPGEDNNYSKDAEGAINCTGLLGPPMLQYLFLQLDRMPHAFVTVFGIGSFH